MKKRKNGKIPKFQNLPTIYFIGKNIWLRKNEKPEKWKIPKNEKMKKTEKVKKRKNGKNPKFPNLPSIYFIGKNLWMRKNAKSEKKWKNEKSEKRKNAKVKKEMEKWTRPSLTVHHAALVAEGRGFDSQLDHIQNYMRSIIIR